MKRLRQLGQGLVRDEKGAAAAELALVLPILVLPMLSVIDLGIYVYDRIQVEASAQAGVVAVQKACLFGHTPATSSNCTNAGTLYTAINNAVQSTSLGNGVSVANSCTGGGSCWDIESYYCANSSNVLVTATNPASGTTTGKISTSGGSGTAASTTATDCSVVGSSTTKPGDYVNIQTTFTYAPLFPGFSVGTLFAGSITSSAWLRLE